jgi:hypothetical protein
MGYVKGRLKNTSAYPFVLWTELRNSLDQEPRLPGSSKYVGCREKLGLMFYISMIMGNDQMTTAAGCLGWLQHSWIVQAVYGKGGLLRVKIRGNVNLYWIYC